MARPLRIEFPGAFYHITSRGDEKRNIYKNSRDHERFLEYLGSAAERYEAVIHGYCLMTNHYHLLLATPRGNLSQIMQHINGAYTTYFNVKHKRAGHLFQSRYKAILVEADEYALTVSRYMHLNPVRAGMVTEPAKHPWSSYGAYIGEVEPPRWLTCAFIQSLLDQSTGRSFDLYRSFVVALTGRDYAWAEGSELDIAHLRYKRPIMRLWGQSWTLPVVGVSGRKGQSWTLPTWTV